VATGGCWRWFPGPGCGSVLELTWVSETIAVCDSVDGAVRRALPGMTEPPFGSRLTGLGSSVMTFQPASQREGALLQDRFTADHLGEIEARLRSEHHLADELLAACSVRSVQRRLP
jgi:hypothetical protein